MLAAAAFGGPRLAMDEMAFDFGYVPQHAKVAHVFYLKSTGDAPLKVDKVTPGCGCTQAPLDKTDIAVGDSARLEIIFDTGRRSGLTTKSPRIETNADAQAVHLRFTADIVPDFEESHLIDIDPFTLDLSRKKSADEEGYKFQITNLSVNDLTLTLADFPSELFIISLPEQIESGSTADGFLQLKEGASPFTEKSFTIELNDEAHTRYTIPVTNTKPAMGVREDIHP